MTTYTPRGQRPTHAQAGTPAGAAGTSQVFPAQANVVLSPDQFKAFVDNYNSSTGPARALIEDNIGVNAVAVKLPTFWVHDPELWFLQTEAVFNSRQPPVTRDATRFNHTVTALPAEALNAVKVLIRMPATVNNRYQRLKETLILAYGKTPAQKHKELIEFASSKEPILDQKVSTLLLHVRELSGDSKEAFERAVLLNRLPEAVRTTLATSDAPNNEAWALEANQVMEAYVLANSPGTVASVTTPALSDVPPAEAPTVAAVSSGSSRQSPLCFVHARYGARAFSCRLAKCPMRDQVQRRPPPPSGNGRAGRQ